MPRPDIDAIRAEMQANIAARTGRNPARGFAMHTKPLDVIALCNYIDALELERKTWFDDAEQAWAALRDFERKVLNLANGLRGIQRTLNRRPAHGRDLNVKEGGNDGEHASREATVDQAR